MSLFIEEWLECLRTKGVYDKNLIRSPFDFFNAFHWISVEYILKLRDGYFRDFAHANKFPPPNHEVWKYVEILAKKEGLLPDKIFSDEEYEKIFV